MSRLQWLWMVRARQQQSRAELEYNVRPVTSMFVAKCSLLNVQNSICNWLWLFQSVVRPFLDGEPEFRFCAYTPVTQNICDALIYYMVHVTHWLVFVVSLVFFSMWGEIAEFADGNGVDATMECCDCMSDAALLAASPKCHETDVIPYVWRDGSGLTCAVYTSLDWCSDGGTFETRNYHKWLECILRSNTALECHTMYLVWW